MRYCVIVFLFVATTSYGQWEAEVMAGVSGYRGDLTQQYILPKTLRPAINVNLKYNFNNDFVIRSGIAWGKVTGNDKNNKDIFIHARNLNFKSQILEISICTEYNLLEPEIFYAYPYIFGGIGLFHFNSYTFDRDNKKTFLRPLSTEGQGIAEYPNKKTYSNTQFCIPFGGGWKYNINDKFEIIYEIGYRLIFTDYLDDVSATYIDPNILLANRGAKAVELAYRAKPLPDGHPLPQGNGAQRGNTSVKDWYFINGIKLLIHLGTPMESLKKEKNKIRVPVLF